MGHFAHDNGADMVVGHHPHLLQPIEIYKGKPIIYSLANYVHDMASFREGRKLDTMLVKATVRDGKLQRLAFVPGVIDGHGPPAFGTPSQLPAIVEHMKAISEPFGTKYTVGSDDVEVVL